MAGLISRSDLFAEFLQNRQRITGKITQIDRKYSRENPTVVNNPTPILLLVCNSQTQSYLSSLLTEYNYSPLLMKDPEELLHSLKERQSAIILVDCCAVTYFGTRILSKIRVSCPLSRVIFLCNKDHLCDKLHRELIKEVMNIGVYACILAPYKEWEILSMVSCNPQ